MSLLSATTRLFLHSVILALPSSYLLYIIKVFTGEDYLAEHVAILSVSVCLAAFSPPPCHNLNLMKNNSTDFSWKWSEDDINYIISTSADLTLTWANWTDAEAGLHSILISCCLGPRLECQSKNTFIKQNEPNERNKGRAEAINYANLRLQPRSRWLKYADSFGLDNLASTVILKQAKVLWNCICFVHHRDL